MRRRRGLALVAIIVALAAAVVGVDVAVPAAEAPAPPRSPDAVTPVAGTWACAVGDERGGTTLDVIAARPGTLGDQPAVVEVDVFASGVRKTTTLPRLFPGTHAATRAAGPGDAPAPDLLTLPGADAGFAGRDGADTDAAGPETRLWFGPGGQPRIIEVTSPAVAGTAGVSSDWSGEPVAVFREWRLGGDEGETDLPPGTVAGGCTRAVADTWVVPGLITTGGSDARLRLVNPYRADATVAVGFVTPQGFEDPIVLQNLTVPSRGIREIQVNEVMPERDDLAAVVRIAAGRVAVEGYQLTRSAIGGVDGASLLAAATAASETWTVPWIVDGEDAATWLWVTNLGDRPAVVELTLNTEGGGIVPDGLAEVTVPPGTLRRIDLHGTVPERVASAAVTLRSDGAPVYASAATRLAPGDVAESGFAVQLGSPATDRLWVTAGAGTTAREEVLYLVNPTGVPAEVDVALFNGSIVLQPPHLQGVEVPPGSLRTLDLGEVLGEVRSWSAFATATTGEVVVGRVGSGGEDAFHLVATPGVPAASWSPVGGGLAARLDHGFTQRIGTSLGVEAPDPLAPPVVRDEDDESVPDEVDVEDDPFDPDDDGDSANPSVDASA